MTTNTNYFIDLDESEKQEFFERIAHLAPDFVECALDGCSTAECADDMIWDEQTDLAYCCPEHEAEDWAVA